ncbi:hypothetical protein N8608_02145 [bacterium]|nr:hypothetical protein [bacterium]
MAKTSLRTLEKQLNQEFKPTHAESQHIDLLGTLGIATKVASKTQRIFELDINGGILLKVFNQMSELRADEKNCQDTADKTKRPVLMGLPFDAFGGSTFIPGTGPIPVFTVKSGPLFADWPLSGHATMTRLAITVKAELAAKAEGEPTPYLTFLKAALNFSDSLDSEEKVQALINRAAESPHVIGLPAALEAASGRGTCQGVLMFNPQKKLDTSVSIPTFSKDSWKIFDLGRAIASETPSSRRAHGIVHRAMIHAMGQDENLYVSYRVSDGVRSELTQFKNKLTAA